MATSARPVALITGASAGIGAALAREAANDGHDLVLVARRREPMEALAAELKSTGPEVTVIPADLSRPGAAAALMKTVEQRGLAIDTLINKSGWTREGFIAPPHRHLRRPPGRLPPAQAPVAATLVIMRRSYAIACA